jgi:hypothetical protein
VYSFGQIDKVTACDMKKVPMAGEALELLALFS